MAAEPHSPWDAYYSIRYGVQKHVQHVHKSLRRITATKIEV